MTSSRLALGGSDQRGSHTPSQVLGSHRKVLHLGRVVIGYVNVPHGHRAEPGNQVAAIALIQARQPECFRDTRNLVISQTTNDHGSTVVVGQT